jgi:RNA polymerase sporulation-specific sigma factor
MIREHNDYEILYEIREGNDEALELMLVKYKPLISKNIYHFNLEYDYDDMLQEGYMILLKSIKFFNMEELKSFTRYFELNLRHCYTSIVTKRVRRKEIFKFNEQYIFEHNHQVKQSSLYYDLYLQEVKNVLTEKEYLVYTLRELKNYSINYICNKLELNSKTVYNSLHRAKLKIHSHFDIDLDK